MQLEFYNRMMKSAVKNLGPNASKSSLDRILTRNFPFKTIGKAHYQVNTTTREKSNRATAVMQTCRKTTLSMADKQQLPSNSNLF